MVKSHDLEKEKVMPYVTSIERLGREEGRQEGRQEALRDVIRETLEVRFGHVSQQLLEKLAAEGSVDRLKGLHRLALKSSTIAAFQRSLPEID
jgi:predicted transposase YdaD